MRVIATQTGFYGGKRQDTGDEFGLYHRDHFSAVWMEPQGWNPDDKEEVAEPDPKPVVKVAAPAPKPIQVSTETTVKPPVTPAVRVDPITGSDI